MPLAQLASPQQRPASGGLTQKPEMQIKPGSQPLLARQAPPGEPGTGAVSSLQAMLRVKVKVKVMMKREADGRMNFSWRGNSQDHARTGTV